MSVKAVHRWYKFFETEGSLHLRGYVLTPFFSARCGLERVWGPVFKKQDMATMVHFAVELLVEDVLETWGASGSLLGIRNLSLRCHINSSG